MNKLLKKIKKYIFLNIPNLPKDCMIVVYGSSAYGKKSSDLDVAFILKQYNKKLYNLIEKYTIQFQIDRGMQIDQEVPYINKLVYTFDELQNILNYSVFPFYKGKYNINPILINEEYFKSTEMKNRLMLNILTTYSVLINGNKKEFENYKMLAWKNLIVMVSSYYDLDVINIEDFTKSLYLDKKTNAYGEDFLGYKESNPKLYWHIKRNLKTILNIMCREKKLIKIDLYNYKVKKNYKKGELKNE